jgi:tripartite-type tricarboxylate transporter receptor subunit TctC
MQGEGLTAGGGGPDELYKIIRRDVEKWRRVVREAKIRE